MLVHFSTTRKIYSENAVAVARVRRVFVDVMKKTDEWETIPLDDNILMGYYIDHDKRL